ncbi:MAG: FkbM family methyltransferase [Patescibacteria group bacterium]
MEIKDNLLTIHTQYGQFMVDRVRDKKMAQGLARSPYPNEHLFTIARAFVNEQSVVIDIGAHIGTFALPLAAMAGNVIAFEPSPEAFALLAHNVAENKASIQLVNKALGSEKGSGTLVVRNAANAGANTLVEGGNIPVTTLDDEVTHANFIKIDVEGMELEVLEGGTRLIERARPVVLFEVNLSQLRAHGASPRALERFFTERGYDLYISLEQKGGVLARVRSATLLTAFIAPRAWLFWSDSAPFDLIAIPEERAVPLRRVGFIAALSSVLKNNLLIKGHRLLAWLGIHS